MSLKPWVVTVLPVGVLPDRPGLLWGNELSAAACARGLMGLTAGAARRANSFRWKSKTANNQYRNGRFKEMVAYLVHQGKTLPKRFGEYSL